MKKDQEELQKVIQNTLESFSEKYIYDLLIPNYKELLWSNLSSSNKKKYLNNTINLYAEYHEGFDIQKIKLIEDEFFNIVKDDKVIEFNGQLIYKEIYKIIGLIDLTCQALEILREKDYPRDFGKFQSNKEKINSKRVLYKNHIIGDERLSNRKEVRLRYWSFTLYYKNKNLFNYFLHDILIGDIIKIKALHEENEISEMILNNLQYFLMQKTTPDAVIKSLGILLYGELTEYLQIPKGKAKRHIQWIIDSLFNSNINTDEFYGHIHIKSSLGFFPILGASRKAKYSDQEKQFVKRRILNDLQDFILMEKEVFEDSYENIIKTPHIRYLSKYPMELFQENPKYSSTNI